MELELSARALEQWAAPLLRGLMAPESPEVWVSVRRDGATVAISTAPDALVERAETRVLVFDLAILAAGDTLELIVTRARGAGLEAPATALAMGAMVSALGAVASREGSRFVLGEASTRIARALLPDAGARAPSGERMRFTAIAAQGDTWILHASSDGAPPESSEASLRAREAAMLTREGDDARLAGALDRARALDVAALERAPRHPEISRRLAEIDQRAGGRAEAALATLVEAEHADAAHTGIVVAELLVEAGDVEAAIATFMRVGDAEPAPALGARAFERAAELSLDDGEALEMLDRAMARAPRSGRLRWARLRKRLAVGRLEDALADVEHLEAQVAGGRAKHVVWRRAGEAWSAAGFRAEAATMFERALRFVPDAPDALAGLGAALVSEGRVARGVALLTHAIELAESRGVSSEDMVLDLARALAESMEDFPAAIARVRTVPQAARRTLEARGLEGRWRARLGDLGGASLAFARLRDLASSRVEANDQSDASARVAFELLLEAATLERDEKVDLFAAQRHLACALRLRPHDAVALRDYRDIGARIARGPLAAMTTHHAGRAEALPAGQTEAPPPPRPSPFDLAFEGSGQPDEGVPDDSEAEVRAAELTQKLQADPTRDDVVDELARLLRKLGRGHELLALLCARLDDATPERRVELLAPTRAALEDLARDAEQAGRLSEAALYRETLLAMV